MSHQANLRYDRDQGGTLLGFQMSTVRKAMSDGKWWTLAALAVEVGANPTSVSARIRDLRKPEFGGFTVDRKYIKSGVWAYRLTPRPIST